MITRDFPYRQLNTLQCLVVRKYLAVSYGSKYFYSIVIWCEKWTLGIEQQCAIFLLFLLSTLVRPGPVSGNPIPCVATKRAFGGG